MVLPNIRGLTITFRLFRRVIQLIVGAVFIIGLAGCTPTFNWAFKAGATGHEMGKAIATDTAGNLYVTGHFSGTVDFDPSSAVLNLVAGGSPAMFVAKYTPTGTLVWAQRINGTGPTEGYAISVETTGDVYVTGSFQGTADFDPGSGTTTITSLGNEDAFVLKLSATGLFVWVRRVGGPAIDRSVSIAVGAGFVSVTGRFSGTVDFDPGTGVFNLSATNPVYGIFVLRLNNAGAFQWARSFGGSTYGSEGTCVTADSAGAIYVGGGFTGGSMAMGSFTLTNSGSLYAGYVAKLNSAGTVVFADRIGPPEVLVKGIALDPSGNVIVAGAFNGGTDFDPGPGVFTLNSIAIDAFVLKLNPAGSFVWARRFGGSNNNSTWAFAVATDANSNIYTTGQFEGTADFDPAAAVFNLTAIGIWSDSFISQLSPGGSFIWTGKQGGNLADAGLGIAVHGCDGAPTQVNVAGRFEGTGDFDPTVGTTNLTSAGSSDMYTAQLTFPFVNLAQHLYVSSQGRVLSYPAWGPPLSSPTIFVPVGSGGPSQPTGLTFGPDCNLYVSNFSSNQVMRFNGATGAPLSSAGNSGAIYVSSQSGGLVTPHGLVFGADGRLYVGSIGTTSGALRYDGVTGAFDINFTGNNPPVFARGLTFGGPAGDLYVTSNHDVLRFNRITGALVTSWNLATDPSAMTHYDLTFGPGGDLYVTALETNKVLRFNGTTGAPMTDLVSAGSGGLSRPIGLAFGPDGNLYVSSSGTSQIIRYNGTTGAFIDVYASGGGLIAPSYLVFGR